MNALRESQLLQEKAETKRPQSSKPITHFFSKRGKTTEGSDDDVQIESADLNAMEKKVQGKKRQKTKKELEEEQRALALNVLHRWSVHV